MEQTLLFGPRTEPTPRPARRKRGVDASTPDHNGICWHDRGDRCHHNDRPKLIFWGRCRSGRRWFWTARLVEEGTPRNEHGWADTQGDAMQAARAAVAQLADGRPAIACMCHGTASAVLKEVNAAKRKERPASGSTEAGAVEYLYARGQVWDREAMDWRDGIVSFRITKKTAKRIYYVRRHRVDEDPDIGFVNRQDLETNGHARKHGSGSWWTEDFHLYATPPELADRRQPEPPDLAELKAAMADAHPDRGGTDAEFIAARARYERAKARATRRETAR